MGEAPAGRWLIWSMEHRAWWRPHSNGYTTRTDKAGQYGYEEALSICIAANQYSDKIEEIMVPAPLQGQLEADMEWIT